MSTAKTNPSSLTAVQRVEAGKLRLQELSTRATRATTLLESLKRQLEEAQAEAQVEHGVGSLTELRSLYARLNAENEALAVKFSRELDEFEAALVAVEAHLSA